MSSTDVAVPEPQLPPGIPPALAGPNPATPVIPTPVLYRLLRAESRLAWLPASATMVSGGVDLWLHEAMLHAIHTNVWAAPLAVAIGAASNGLTSLITTWLLSRHDALDGLAVKKIGWGSVAAGAVLTLFGVQPVIDAGYVAAAAVATGPWHKRRWQARRALRQQMLATGTPGRDLAQLTAFPGPGTQVVVVSSAAPLVEDPLRELAEIITRWARGVATGAVPGSQLTDGQRHAEGRMSFVLHGGEKGTTLETINKARDTIAGALRLKLPDADGSGGQDIVVDQPHGIGLDRGQYRMQIISMSSSTATSARVTARIISSPDNPYRIRIGVYIDDGTPAFWDLADKNGVWGGAIVAGTGLGKTSLVELICYRARQMGFHVLYIDPTESSSPILPDHATWPVLGAARSMAALRFLEEAAATRQKWLTGHKVGKILPGMTAPCAPNGARPNPNCPCGGVVPPPIVAVVEECNKVFGKVIPGSTTKQGVPWGELAQHVRKLGIGIITVTQLPDLTAFGGVDLLRSNVAVQNLLAMHIRSNVGGTLIPGLPYNPRLIPQRQGRALLCGQGSRTMEVQLDRLPRTEDAADVGGVGPFAEDLYQALPPVSAYTADAAAADRWLPFDGDGADTGVAQALADLADILAGAAPHPTTSTSPGGRHAAAPTGDPTVAWAAPVTVPLDPPTDAELEAMYAAPAAPLTQAPAELPADTAAVLAALAASDLASGAEEWVPSETVLGVVAQALGWPVNTEGGRRLSAALRAVGVESDRPSIAGRKVTAYRRWDLRQAVRRHHNTNAA